MDERIITFRDAAAELIAAASISLPDDVEGRLNELARHETDAGAGEIYQVILRNLHLAKRLKRPLCQDTGIPQFFVEAGTESPHLDIIGTALSEAVKKATAEIPLRHNAVEPFSEKNTGGNTGEGSPWIEYELVPGSSDIRIKLYLAGGGSSLPGRSKVLTPLEGMEGVKRFVYETVTEWGVNACPPLIVGVGIGSCADTAAVLSKRALIRNLGTHNEDPGAAALENELREGLDSIGIAPLGFGGSFSVLGVNVECAVRHTATLGVGISTGCWASRRAEMLLHEDLSFELLSHRYHAEVLDR